MVWKVVTEVSAVDGDGFAVGEAAHQIPVRFLVTKAWPAVDLGFFDEVLERAPSRSVEQRLARVAVIESYLPVRGRYFLKRTGMQCAKSIRGGAICVTAPNSQRSTFTRKFWTRYA